MISLFKQTNELVMKIDNFLDLTAEANLHFVEGVKLYMEERFDDFEERLKQVSKTESKADSIRLDVESQLYTQTLIPESRGDVLGILESMDSIVDKFKSTMMEFSIECPDFPKDIKKNLIELTTPVSKSVENLVCAVRAYFYNITSVKDYLHQVKFFEGEADSLSEKILREIFKDEIDLSQKMHMRYFVYHIDTVADYAEDVANRLAIATIKRIV